MRGLLYTCKGCMQRRDSGLKGACEPCQASPRFLQERAHNRVKAEVRAGRLPRAKLLSCVDCSKPAHDYDHRDYTQPLHVAPVCRKCNAARGPADVWTAEHPAPAEQAAA